MPRSLDLVLQDELNQLAESGLRRSLPHSDRSSLLNFSSNDYLGLAGHPKVIAAASSANSQVGARAARLIGGDSSAHHELEAEVAKLKRAEAALLFSSGYQANVGAITALVGPEDAVFSDTLNHASLIDGCRLSRAKLFHYKHLDVANLERKLKAAQHFRRRLIVTDSVFGMDGDLAPLRDIAKLAQTHDAIVYVDEAHGTGVYGPEGAGLVSAVDAAVDLQLVTFGKALGTFGAAIVGSRVLIDYLMNRARTFIFTTALPPALCTATTTAIRVCMSAEGDELRQRLRDNVQQLVDGLANCGISSQNNSSPIQPLIIGEAQKALHLSRSLAERGFFVQAIRPPTVPNGTSRLRIAVTAAHSSAEIAALLDAITRVMS